MAIILDNKTKKNENKDFAARSDKANASSNEKLFDLCVVSLGFIYPSARHHMRCYFFFYKTKKEEK